MSAFTIHDADVVVSFTCRCQPDNTPILLMTVNGEIICRRCGHAYRVLMMYYDSARGGGIDVKLGRRQLITDGPALVLPYTKQ